MTNEQLIEAYKSGFEKQAACAVMVREAEAEFEKLSPREQIEQRLTRKQMHILFEMTDKMLAAMREEIELRGIVANTEIEAEFEKHYGAPKADA